MPRSGDTGRVASARALAYLFLAAGLLGLTYEIVAYLQGWPAPYNEIITVNSFVLALVCARSSEKLPMWALEVLLAIGTLMITVTIAFGGSGVSADSFFYLWVCLFAFYFFPARHAVAHLGFMAALYGLVLYTSNAPSPWTQWTITLGTLIIVGPLVAIVKQHVEALIAELSDAAVCDPLTKLLNRRGLEQIFEEELERARRGTGDLSLLCGDLDYFKEVNDGYGHGAGDDVLRRVADIFGKATRQIDTVARIGGEEFAILLPETNSQGAFIVAEKLRKQVQEAFENDPVKLTVSFGLATYGTDGTSADELITTGDNALYAAKEMGRNRSVTYSSDVTAVLAQADMHKKSQSKTHLATLLTLAEALDLRDNSTGSHSLAVARYAELMAQELGMDEDKVERMRLAGLLHDVGKIGVPDSVLWKPGPLDEEEWLLMKRHPEIGARILGPIDFRDIQEWVIAHHERPDGRGYPHGLVDEEIPLGAKVLAVADAYEAMTADRVYRKSMGHPAAQAELANCVGTHFDARVVDAFMRVIEREGIGDDAPILLPVSNDYVDAPAAPERPDEAHEAGTDGDTQAA